MSESDAVPEPDEPRVDAAGGAVPPVPERSADDTDTGWGEMPGGAAGRSDERAEDHEAWLREQRPPHWD